MQTSSDILCFEKQLLKSDMSMKKTMCYLSTVLMIIACSGNEINTIDNPGSNSNSGSNSGSSSGSDSGSSDSGTDESGTDDSGITTVDGTICITFSESGAKITGDSAGIVSADGNEVTAINTTENCFTYELSGTASSGFFKIYSDVKQVITLNGLNLKNPDGAAINNQSHKYTSVIVNGDNFLADGSVNSSGNYNSESSDEDMKAAFFSEGQLIFSGDGNLTVTATGKAGITSDDYIRITGSPTISINSKSGHGLRGKDNVFIESGSVDITVAGTGKKGITTDGEFRITDGSVTITSTSAAGLVDSELTGAAGIKADSLVTVNGGKLTVTTSGTGAKGINCDGDGHFNSGTLNITVKGSNYGSSSGGNQRPGWGGSDSSSDNTSAAKGLKFDGNLYFDGADITASASSHEAIEAKGKIEISAGSINATSSDDAVNSGSDMTITGGNVYAFSSGNDGLDANGNMYVKGGYIYAVGSGSPEVALDANTEQNYKLYISGGSLVAFGGIESGSSITQPVISISSWTSNTSYSLYDGSTLLLEFTSPSKGGSGIVISHPNLKSGSSYTFKSGSSSSTVTASLSAQSGGGDGGHGGGPGGRW